MSLQIGDSHRDDGETGNEPALGRRIFSQVFFLTNLKWQHIQVRSKSEELEVR